jgi:hypothetical protein
MIIHSHRHIIIVIIISNPAPLIVRFHDDEASKDDDSSPFVEEIVMEGNPKAPRFHLEQQAEPPHEAYVQHVCATFYVARSYFRNLIGIFSPFFSPSLARSLLAGAKGMASSRFPRALFSEIIEIN